jgi:hypothetical protein
MIDVRCSCGAVYHAHEDLIGRSLQCNNPACRKVLRIERPAIKPYKEPSDLLERVVAEQTIREEKPLGGAEYARIRRDRRIGIGIVSVLIISAFAWFLLRTSGPESPQRPEAKPEPPSEPTQSATQGYLEPLPIPKQSEMNLKPLKPVKPPPRLKPAPLIPTAAIPENAPASETKPQAVVVTPACAVGKQPERPETGYAIESPEGTQGESTLEIKNGSPLDAAVRLFSTSPNRSSRFVYVRSHDSYTLQEIQPDTYSLVFDLGNQWISDCGQFLRDEVIHEFEKPLTFERKETNEAVYATATTVTLHEVPFGNVRTKRIDRKRFLQGSRRYSLRQ